MTDEIPNISALLDKLSNQGKHPVLTGDLGLAGIPGTIYAPEEMRGVPGVVFGHDWTVPASGYHALCRHLASWGIAVAIPNTHTGAVANHRAFATDLVTSLDILAGVKLGDGSTTVSPDHLGVAGHGMGGGAAVLAAADRSDVQAVAAIYPSVTAPSNYDAAPHVSAPGLILAAQDDIVGTGDPARLAALWGGPVAYRIVEKATSQGIVESVLRSLTIGGGLPQRNIQKVVRGLVTGFLLYTLADENKYKDFAELAVEAKSVTYLTRSQISAAKDPSSSSALAGLLGR
ncbi:MAG: dienelactone hydrolase family protein [Corynebacterium sp.]|nr:dienelactone hydrolase family protein [Corynebacterium sp.]